MLTFEETKFIEENENLINSRDFDAIYNKVYNEMYNPIENARSRRLLFLIGHLIGGDKAFRLSLVDRGVSKSIHRANAGQHRVRIYLEILLGQGPKPIHFLKGTLRPESLTWEMISGATAKLLKGIVGSINYDTSSIHKHLGEEYIKTKGIYN